MRKDKPTEQHPGILPAPAISGVLWKWREDIGGETIRPLRLYLQFGRRRPVQLPVFRIESSRDESYSVTLCGAYAMRLRTHDSTGGRVISNCKFLLCYRGRREFCARFAG